jgi:hypothetical protein
MSRLGHCPSHLSTSAKMLFLCSAQQRRSAAPRFGKSWTSLGFGTTASRPCWSNCIHNLRLAYHRQNERGSFSIGVIVLTSPSLVPTMSILVEDAPCLRRELSTMMESFSESQLAPTPLTPCANRSLRRPLAVNDRTVQCSLMVIEGRQYVAVYYVTRFTFIRCAGALTIQWRQPC